MADYGVTNTGFVQKYYENIVADKRAKARELFGNSIDVTDSSVFGQFINSMSYEEALIYQILENVYYSRYIQFATGQALDDVVYAKGLFRKNGTKATGTVTFTKNPAYTRDVYIPVGTTIADIDGFYPFVTTVSATISTSQSTVDVPVESKYVGLQYNVASHKLSYIVTPIGGLQSVDNSLPCINGTDRETDEALRLRSMNYIPGVVGTVQGLINNAKSIPDVINVSMLEFFETTDNLAYMNISGESLSTMPANSFILFFNGVNDNNKADILQMIEDTRAAGIRGEAVAAQTISVDINLNCTYDPLTTTTDVIATSIRESVSLLLSENGFNGIITYSALLKVVMEDDNVNQINSLSATANLTPSVTISALGEEIDMTSASNRDKCLVVGNVSVNT